MNKSSKIKVLPNIEDVIRNRGYNFPSELDDTTQAWVRHINKMWSSWKKSDTFLKTVTDFFNSIPDPFTTALVIIVKNEEFKDCKPKTLPFCIIEALKVWSDSNRKVASDDRKVVAFIIASQQRNQAFFNLVCDTYASSTACKEIIPLINTMIDNGHFKQALHSLMALRITMDIDTLNILVPLLTQDKTCQLDDFFVQFPDQVEPFVKHIDSLLDKSVNLMDYFQHYVFDRKIPEVKWEKLYHKPLGKLIARLCSKYNIPLTTCENLYKSRANRMLRYLVHQKYQERKVGDTAWEDMVKDTLDQHPESVDEFIETLTEYDPKEAVRWLDMLNVSLSNYPMLERYVEAQEKCLAGPSEDWDLEEDKTEKCFYKLSVSPSIIKIVDTPAALFNCIKYLETQTVIAMDSEWKPSFTARKESKVAIMQLATHDQIFIIDIIALNKVEFSNLWALLKNIFENQNIIKVGFGMETDLREIKNTVLLLQSMKLKSNCFLDLSLLWRTFNQAKLTLPHQNDVTGASLSSLVECCFGKPLNKEEQFSNWECRPLRPTQIEYAALDAHVLLLIYDVFQNIFRTNNTDFDEVCNHVMF